MFKNKIFHSTYFFMKNKIRVIFKKGVKRQKNKLRFYLAKKILFDKIPRLSLF